ncbi:MAG: type IV pilus assembly protein PilM [Candidatus Microgenomates bacterium]
MSSQYFGLEFGSSSIKVAQVTVTGPKAFVVTALGSGPNSAGSLDFADPMISQKIAASLKKVLTESGIKEKRVVVAIPESHVFSRIIEMPPMSEAELTSAISWEAEQFVPIPIADVELDYSIVDSGSSNKDKKMLVYMVAAPKKKLQSMVDFLINVGLDPIAVESEMVAIARSLSYLPSVGPTLILSLGALSTLIGILKGSSLLFSYVTQVGGVALTRSLSQSLTLPLPQAEEYKKTYGVDPNHLEGKVRRGLLIGLSQIVDEMRKAMEYYATTHNERIGRILLTSGGAYLPGLVTYLTEEFGGVEVVVADPLSVGKAARGLMIPKDRAHMAVALGLAQRTF